MSSGACSDAPPTTALDEGEWSGRHLAETRWVLELAQLTVDPVFLPVGVPRGDKQPVVLLPGFLAGDHTLAILAGWLLRLGYRPHTCGFIANVDCSERAASRIEHRIRALHSETGRRVALLGHSRGGHFAQALATRLPHLVSHTLSLGADLQAMFGISRPTEYAVAGARRMLRLTHRALTPECLTAACSCGFTRDFSAPFPADHVRMTSIYSKGDGVVRWQRCLVAHATCVEVAGSHVGLIYNRHCYHAIADALAQPALPAPRPARAR